MRRRNADMPPSSPRRKRVDQRREGWGALIRVTACCVLISVAVGTVVPRLAGGLGGGVETVGPSVGFVDVRVPAETVPVNLGRPIGSVAGGTLDAQVFMCSLDRDTYFHQPYKYPMFKDLVRLSGGCQGAQSTTTSISKLQEEIDANPDGYLEPTGFVFHMSRCGSTLTANLMGSSPHNIVYSESKPPVAVMSLCDQVRCTEEQRVAALRTVILAMGKTSFHKHMFFKFQSSQTRFIHYYRKAFPNTPWVFVYRDPVPVMMSLLGFKAGMRQRPSRSTPCLRSMGAPPDETAKLLGMSTSEAKNAPDERYCAAHLATLVESALGSVDDAAASGGAEGHAVDYETLPNAIVPVMSELFKAPLTPEEEYYALEISSWYAKSRGEAYNFSPDTKAKEDHASPEVEQAASSILEPFYPRLHEAGVAASSIPKELAVGYSPGDKRSAQGEVPSIPQISDEDFYATPEHMRGLDRVVDPLAPDFMASSKFKSMPMEAFECPDTPPADYPKGYPAMDVINHWNPDDADQVPPLHYLSTCRFDYQRELAKAERYSSAEKPFILYNIPSVDAASGRWSDPAYMEKIFGATRKYATEHSTDNHFMYFNHKLAKQAKHAQHSELNLTDWKPPTDSVNLSYRQWLDLALKHGKGDGEHWYFRVGDANNKVVLNEMEIFQKPENGKGNIFLVDPRGQRGIHCRFGMPGVIAEAHFDGSRNMVAMVSGVRRWIMAHPNQCESMYLLPKAHPSGRHSDVDWSNPDLDKFPDFPKTLISEVLLKAGEVLYVPTQWFHYISNIGINAQCNSRSGIAMDYDGDLDKCGFGSHSSRQRSRRPVKKSVYN
ncbi:Hypoxia-inducible factor 1 alpha inhibitor (Hypoxia-inducible factor asparagine hydroxylase) [Ectocarpus siliculosus]|uniref:Hypoxia-inducible factor 1 alpha inhibitor (Hypoxia-inducible factor asparagine hydroxylase) n=1 Tax=Ectocarpus siliculosus TaxID=2880 RepID=D7FL26_ECTSI|nr:Hypoxia-inducible factor 1 alpha inhibitor (Hypoxia-inducible factor asparagine hydroxylase) [Ectocarpus siliculosus]|eukprot:CBJ29563.1 Hypoxia-inducible factor 1 alpha inhibitor (Hypoxia-inducible factor asparagine hydroxylase) [Ectocarpus siliculosus]